MTFLVPLPETFELPRMTTRRSTEPEALGIFELLRDAGPADVQLVLDQCNRRLLDPVAAQQDPVGQCLSSLFAFYADEHVRPSRAMYDEWLGRQPEQRRAWLVSSNVIRRRVGWARATATLGGEPLLSDVDVRAVRRTAWGPAFTREELIASLLWCSERLGSVSFGGLRYIREAREYYFEQDGSEEPLHLPRSDQPFRRVFGHWSAALEAAGLDGTQYRAHQRRGPVALSEELLVESVRRAAAQFAPERLTLDHYRVYRRQLADQGEWAPSDDTIRERIGWLRALERAGARPPARFSDEDLVDCVAEAVEFYDERLSRRLYDEWRAMRLSEDPFLDVPCSVTIALRIGWSDARERGIARLAEWWDAPPPDGDAGEVSS